LALIWDITDSLDLLLNDYEVYKTVVTKRR